MLQLGPGTCLYRPGIQVIDLCTPQGQQKGRVGRNNKLTAKKRDTAYDDLSMLYQIVTRAVNSLSVVVYDNVELFEQLVHIKNHN